MDPETEVRTRRLGLIDAINRRDLDGLKSYIHPSFVAVAKYKILFFEREGSMDYEAMMAHVERTFRLCNDVREEVKIDGVKIEGNKALLTTTLIDHSTVLGLHHRSEQPGTETWERIGGQWMFVKEVRYYAGRQPPGAES